MRPLVEAVEQPGLARGGGWQRATDADADGDGGDGDGGQRSVGRGAPPPLVRAGACGARIAGAPGADEPGDIHLLRAVGAGDVRAYEKLVLRYRTRLRALCLHHLHDPEAVEDALQETFLRLLRFGAEAASVVNLGAWLHRVARNLCLDELRRPGGERQPPVGPLRRAQLGRDPRSRLPRRAPGGVQEPPARRGAGAQARGTAQATETKLAPILEAVAAGRLRGAAAIGLWVGRVLGKYKVGKHFELAITDTSLTITRKAAEIAAEAALDGIYVVRSSVAEDRLDSAAVARTYKLLSHVERAFRCWKSVDLRVRPIRHRREDRVRAHILLCMLAY